MASATEAEEFLDPSFGSGASAEVVGNVQDDAKGGRAVETILQKLPRDAEAMLGQSAKLVCLSKLLPKLAKQGHRTLVFSQSVKMLDLVQICCLKPNGLRCLRIDGQTDPASRAEKVAKFQREKERFQCMLLTSNVGGVGLNLTSADRVVLVDPSWNPATDAQAVDRAFRIGQEKEVRVYRLIMSGLIEDKMFRLQVFKMGLTKTALEADQKQCYFTAREIRALFEWTEPAVGETRKLLQDKHGSELDEAVFEAAKDDGSEEGWLSTTLGLSDFGSLYGASVEEDEPEEQDGASAALVLEAKEKLSAADEKLQKATEAKQAAEAAQEELRVNFEAASSACDLAREAKLAREEQAKEKAASLKHAKGAEQGAQKRLDKAFKAKAALQDSHFVAQQAAETAMGSLNTAEAAVADAIVAAKAIEGSFVKAFEAVEKQFSIVGPGGRAASADGVVDAKADATRKAVKALEKLKSTWETYCTRQAELDTAEDEFHKSEQLLAEAEREQTLLGNGDDDEGVAGSDAAKLAIARKGAELAKRGREKERLRAEQGLQKAQKKADDSREAAQQALQTLQEAGQAFVESFVKTTVRTVRADQVKAAQAATKASLRPLNSSFQSTKKGRDGVSKALQLRKKAQTKHASAATSEVEARMRLAEGEKEVEEANQEETALRAAREEAEARLAEAEAEKRNAEAEEVQSKKHRDELKAAMPGAKERVKEAKLAEKEATSERSALHAKCSKVEREKTQLEEAKSAAVQMLKAEEYDPSQVTNAYEKKAH
uniref:DNA excision repair protein ERCC-6 n=1 Tax=Crypthecodinium cohnii TaxID=2866 RepID=A0A516AGI2_CRYCO|nr:DNA excision repair protein ERCC-6 [Crypthecodinium cohnii]USW07849.1 DNA excision repair protein ERCC-6 [Crypthecodinium cohnii]USW07850.1 DNA excision repair protein ERCC-6 [Crypthecodinium cohnii]